MPLAVHPQRNDASCVRGITDRAKSYVCFQSALRATVANSAGTPTI